MSERTTGASDEQIERAAKRRYYDINGYYGNEWKDKQTNLTRTIAVAEMSKWAGWMVDTEERIVTVKDLRMIVGGLDTAMLENGDCPELTQAAMRVWELIGDAS